MKKLISMTDYVLQQYEEIQQSNVFENNCFNYAKFLKQPLTLGMFVPCDLEGNIMKEPYMVFADDNEECDDYIKLFCEAKERCLFEIHSFEEDSENFWYFGLDEFKLIGIDKSEIVELLVTYGIELTLTAQKQIS